MRRYPICKLSTALTLQVCKRRYYRILGRHQLEPISLGFKVVLKGGLGLLLLQLQLINLLILILFHHFVTEPEGPPPRYSAHGLHQGKSCPGGCV